jgi:hypothetical protein
LVEPESPSLRVFFQGARYYPLSYLFFLDESGHDHKNCPYEVRGGIVLHASKL